MWNRKHLNSLVRKHLNIERVKEIRNPCESIDLERKIMFVAVPKTGSASVRHNTRGRPHYLVPQEHLNFRESRDSLMAFILRERLGRNWQFPAHGVPSYEELVSVRDQLVDAMIKFSVVRNPWARVVSMFFRKEGIKLCDDMEFERFVDQLCYASDTCVNPSRHQNQMDWLCDEHGRMAMDFIEKLEYLDERRDEVNERLEGRCRIGEQKLNLNPRSPSARYKEIYSQAARKKVARLFEKDIDIFGYTF